MPKSMKYIMNRNNNKMKHLAVLALLLVCCASRVWAQELSKEELQAFTKQCQERIDALQMGMEIIADKEQEWEIRNHYVETIPEMFLGDGDPWTDPATGQKHAAVTMQVSSLTPNGIRVSNPTLKQYLRNLRDLKGYTSVRITKAKTCFVSNFMPVYGREGVYVATCTFFQYFEGRIGEQIAYGDETQKEVHVEIRRVPDGSVGTHWEMKFGDINVAQTQKLK